MSSVGLRPQARRDVVELATYMGRDNILAADRFLDAATETFNLLVASPQLGELQPSSDKRLVGLRIFQGFSNHLVCYLEKPYGVEIVRVLHGARDLNARLSAEQ